MNQPASISQDQIDQFQQDGALVIRQAISASELNVLRRGIDQSAIANKRWIKQLKKCY